jgi:Glycoside hydrolase family 44
MSRPTSRFFSIALALLALGCIKRTGPISAGPGKTSSGSSSALEAKNARIAGVPRTDLIAGPWDKAFELAGEDVKKVQLSTISVADMPFAEAMRVEIKEETGHEWAVQLRALTAAPVETGDAILVTFFLRTEVPQQGGVGETQFVFELSQGPFTKSVQYPVQGSTEWNKVQIRFQSAGSYPAGGAQMVFRLGYDPEVLDLGGVKVENFGKKLAVGALPSTQAIDNRREREATAAIARAAQAAQGSAKEGGDLHFEIAPSKVIRTISPYVYGINSQPDGGIGVPVRRTGGNRQTAYNWEIDASNAGNDYEHSSDLWACQSLGYKDCDQPGAQYLDFTRANRTAGTDSLVTIPLVDYVVADHAGSVPERDKAPSKRWVRSLAKKPGPFTLSPDLSDGAVYQDEFVNFLVQKLGKAADGGVKFYSLDNEPALWTSTHPRVHPEKTRYDEMVTRSEGIADAITKIDPGAVVLGGVMFGWAEYKSLGDAPDAKEHNEKYGMYVDYFLAAMKDLEAKHHRRLVHALDVHWYPEAKGAKRITERDISPKTMAARLQAPRSLWDPSYVEKSWIASEIGKPIRLIPWLLERIDERYPGTKLTMTEYDYGMGDHISGGLAQADALGVFGREGLYMANYWGNGAGNSDLPPYIKAAFKLYRNYDGKHGMYGDTAVEATPTDIAKATIYAAKDSKHPGTLTVIVINKDQQATYGGKFDIRGGGYGSAKVYAFDASKADIQSLPDVAIKNDHLEYRLPPLSATLFVCQAR